MNLQKNKVIRLSKQYAPTLCWPVLTAAQGPHTHVNTTQFYCWMQEPIPTKSCLSSLTDRLFKASTHKHRHAILNQINKQINKLISMEGMTLVTDELWIPWCIIHICKRTHLPQVEKLFVTELQMWPSWGNIIRFTNSYIEKCNLQKTASFSLPCCLCHYST